MNKAKPNFYLDTYMSLKDGDKPQLVFLTNAFIKDSDNSEAACPTLTTPLNSVVNEFISYARGELTPEQRDWVIKQINRLAKKITNRLNEYP